MIKMISRQQIVFVALKMALSNAQGALKPSYIVRIFTNESHLIAMMISMNRSQRFKIYKRHFFFHFIFLAAALL